MLKYREIEVADAPHLVRLRTDNSTWPYLNDPTFYNCVQTENWIKTLGGKSRRIIVESTDERKVSDPSKFILIDHNPFVGVIRLDNIDNANRSICVGLDISPEYRGKGLSKEIYKWLLDYLFNSMNFHLAWLEVIGTNERAISLYKKMGFKIDGVLRDRVFRDGKYNYVLLMSILSNEYESA